MNFYEDVAKIFGVELEEEFIITLKGKRIGCKYKFTEYGFRVFDTASNFWVDTDILILLKTPKEDIKITKVPFTPRRNEYYYTLAPMSDIHDQDVIKTQWLDSAEDFKVYFLGLVWQSEEIAKKNAPKAFEKLLKYYKENC